MVKTVAFFKRKAGLSREEFFNHYEMVHAPLGMKHIPNMKGYVRNHIPVSSSADDLEWDCISEFWFENMDEFQKVTDYLQSDSSQAVHDDEETFMDRSKSVFFFVDEKVLEMQGLAAPHEVVIENTAKTMVLAKKTPNISHRDYTLYVEEVCIPAILKCSDGLRACLLNHARSVPGWHEPLFDYIIEMWYERGEDCISRINLWDEEGSSSKHLELITLPVIECVSMIIG